MGIELRLKEDGLTDGVAVGVGDPVGMILVDLFSGLDGAAKEAVERLRVMINGLESGILGETGLELVEEIGTLAFEFLEDTPLGFAGQFG